MTYFFCLIYSRGCKFGKPRHCAGWPLARPPRAEQRSTPQFAVAPSGAKPETVTAVAVFSRVYCIKSLAPSNHHSPSKR